MKKVNLFEFFDLGEKIQAAETAVGLEQAKGSELYISLSTLKGPLASLWRGDYGFVASRRLAAELVKAIDQWIKFNIMKSENAEEIDFEKFKQSFSNWETYFARSALQKFKTVFEAECRDIDAYSIEQISIYKMSSLVVEASLVFPSSIRNRISKRALDEFDSSGKCLAFDLYTACGFHALRGLEIIMKDYLSIFDIDPKRMKNWSILLKAANRLIHRTDCSRKPSAKVAAMLDRIRELDRNPLMHPEDKLDQVSAIMIMNICIVTVSEMIKHEIELEEGGSQERLSGASENSSLRLITEGEALEQEARA